MYSAQLIEMLAPLTHAERLTAAERERFALAPVEGGSSQRTLFAKRINRVRMTALHRLSVHASRIWHAVPARVAAHIE
jgi:hypothetical protein